MVSRVGLEVVTGGAIGSAVMTAVRWAAPAFGLVAALATSGCESCGSSRETSPRAGERAGLSEEMAGRVLARVGERTITLGDYAAVLERMDPLERLRYQTADRRKELLEELIDLELLAREAEARGLAEQPETRALVDEMLRDEVLRQRRANVPRPEQIAAADVRAYYEAHQAELAEPERRRVAAFSLESGVRARAVLREALAADAAAWARLVAEHAPEQAAPSGDRTDARPGLELAADLGLVNAPGSGASENDRVPEPLRAAVFRIERVGGVYPEPVPHAGRFFIVRLTGQQAARQRTLPEVESLVRARLVRERIEQEDRALLERLRQEIPVRVNEAELERVPEPQSVSAP